GGVMLVASCAVGRAKQMISLCQLLIEQKRIPPLPIYLDSPMAVSGMNIYNRYSEEHDLVAALACDPGFRFDLRHVRLAKTVPESKAINDEHGPAVII